MERPQTYTPSLRCFAYIPTKTVGTCAPPAGEPQKKIKRQRAKVKSRTFKNPCQENKKSRYRVLVSFARHGRSQAQAFPRKPESTQQANRNAPTTNWIPAPRLRGDELRGNDKSFERDPISNDTSTRYGNAELVFNSADLRRLISSLCRIHPDKNRRDVWSARRSLADLVS